MSELRYILNNSEAMLLLSSEKFKSKAEEIVKEGLEKSTDLNVLAKRTSGASLKDEVVLEKTDEPQGGLMLYTSGTTNRPVGHSR